MTRLTVFILLIALSGNPAFSKEADVFPQAEKVLEALVKEKADVTTNHLYVSPVKKVGKDEFAWVYWKEKRQLIRWEPFDAKRWKKALLYSRQVLDIDKDVVPTAEDIKGSTYLVDEDWACRTIGDCMKNGREYIIQKEAGRK